MHTHTHTHKTETNPEITTVVSSTQLVILQILTEQELHANSIVSDTDQVSSFAKFIDIARGIGHIINEQDNFSY